MTNRGVGPRMMAVFAALCAPAVALRWLHPGAFRIDAFAPYWALLIAGAALLAVGLLMHEAAVGPMKRAFADGRLVTTGAFGLCRHPIYASVVLFDVPGVMLIINSWMGLAAVPLMWVILRLMVRREERWLEDRFGDEYREYRRRVPAVLPVGWLTRALR